MRRSLRMVVAVTAAVMLSGVGTASAQLPTTNDPRVGLPAGFDNAGVAKLGLDLAAHQNKPTGFFDPSNPGSLSFANSDMAFQGNYAFVGNFAGFNVYDISNPSAPVLRTSYVCPGGQGDLSVYGDLLFMSVEETRGRKDCGAQGAPGTVNPDRFRGVRIFNIADLDHITQFNGVQTCRGSHTHTLVRGNDSNDSVYIYVQGTAGVRSADELAGCNASNDPASTNPSQWRIEVIKVPLANPNAAAVVNEPRLFKNETTGALNGLQNAPQTPQHPSGMNWGPTPDTNSCHDITVYEDLNIAAGACEGNGLLIDISDPANPKRIDAVADPLWAYWHGATFSNDGRYVVFTDEWGGGTGARCRATDQASWGGNSIYEIVNKKLVFRSYYKLPVVQTNQENCVSHIPSLIPVKGRNIFVQAWYQGGASVVDFTDAAHPVEIGYFDRGPINATQLVTGGYWSTYWYNGHVYSSEIARGLDVLAVTPTDKLSAGELAQASAVKTPRLNVQDQEPFPVAYADGGAGGSVPATLSLSLGTPASFGAFTPGLAKDYTAQSQANVISTAGNAALSVADPSSTATGHLVNGAFSLPSVLQAQAGSPAAGAPGAYANVGGSSAPTALASWTNPVSNDPVTIGFKQTIGANDALRTGSYSKTLTFTLSTTQP